jgi:hypothetical protein
VGKVYIQQDRAYTTVGHHAAGAWPRHLDMEMSGSGVVFQHPTYRQIKLLGDE